MSFCVSVKTFEYDVFWKKIILFLKDLKCFYRSNLQELNKTFSVLEGKLFGGKRNQALMIVTAIKQNLCQWKHSLNINAEHY